MEIVGSTVSTVTDTLTRPVFPARSTAANRIGGGPSATPRNVYEVAAAPSTLTSRWSIPEVASDAVHVSMTEFEPKIWPEVGAVMDAIGKVASTVTSTESDVDDPARSTARTLIVCGPSETPVSV